MSAHLFEQLQAVRNSLLVRYPRTEIRGDGQVVVMKFDKFVVEVLPASAG